MKSTKLPLVFVLSFTTVVLLLTVTLLTKMILGQERKAVPSAKKEERLSPKKEISSSSKKPVNPLAGKEEETSPESELREQAYVYVTNTLAGINEITSDNRIQGAHLRADLAGLLCAYGERARAVEMFRQSIKDILESKDDLVSGGKNSKGEQSKVDVYSVLDLATQLVNSAAKCDPNAKSLITKDLDSLLNLKDSAEKRADSEKQLSETPPTEAIPAVVPDEMWGTQPSLGRRMAAQILTNDAHEKIGSGGFDEAESLLRQSIKYCITTPFVTALARLMKDKPDAASLLFMEAARQVQALPSGAEVYSLNFGLRPLGINPISAKPTANQRNNSLIESYLATVNALILSKDNVQIGSSSYAVGLVNAAASLFANFHPETLPIVETWVKDATNKFPSTTQSVIRKAPAAWESTADKIARYENIALNTKDPLQQDQAYASLASAMIQDGKFDKAAEWANKISEVKLRQEISDGLTARQLSFKLAEIGDNPYSSLVPAITGIYSPTLRAQLYIQLAKAAAKLELANVEARRDWTVSYNALQDATTIANTLSPSVAQTHLFFSIAGTYAEFDSIKALLILADAAQSIGRHEDQPASKLGKKASDVTVIRFDSTGTFSRMVFDDQEEYKKPYDLSIFRKLAQVNFGTAWLSASQIDDKLLQTTAKYEVCAALILDYKVTKDGGTKRPQSREEKGNGEKK